MTRAGRLCAAVLLCAAAGLAQAQAFPSRPIRIIVPISAGSSTDIIARLTADKLRDALGQPVIVENRPGAGGTIGGAIVAKAPPDGYTLFVHSNAHTVNAALYSNLPYDPLGDFAGVTNLVTLPNVLVVAPSKNLRSVAELQAAAKASRDKLTFGSGGVGSAAHMNGEHFRAMAKFDAIHVPFRGTPEAMVDTMAGRIDFSFLPLASILSSLKDGKLLPLAVASEQRSRLLPEVPTTVEAGVPNSSFMIWIGMMAPAQTPRDVVNLINREVVKAYQTPDVVQRLAALGADPATNKPEEFDASMRRELATLKEVVRAAGIKLDN